jgi:uncharacterized membrane protein
MRRACWLVLMVAAAAAIAAGCSDGAGDSCPGLADGCPATPPSVSAEIAIVVQNHCLSCHGPGGDDAALPLTSYAEIVMHEMAILPQVASCRMPPATSLPLTTAQRQDFVAWIACGAPQN